jgi:Xaa-Pro dipeptidase
LNALCLNVQIRNLRLLNHQISEPDVLILCELQQQAYEVPEAFHQNAYSCIIHGIGMCDEYPYILPRFRDPDQYDGKLEAGMVVCVESYMGAVGDRDGVKLEQQVLVTKNGYETLTSFPYEEPMLE